MTTIPLPPSSPNLPITPEAARKVLATGVWEEDPALKLVVQDTIRAENFEAQKAWVMAWNSAVAMYQSPVTARYWEGTQTERANVPFYTVAQHVNSLVPQIMNGLFYDDPPFMVEQRPGTTGAAARAAGAVLAYQLGEINFKQHLEWGVTNAVLFGTGIWKWGWETFTRERKVYKRDSKAVSIPGPIGDTEIDPPDDDEIIEETIEEYIDRPTFEHIVNLRHVLVDPGLNVPDIRKAKYVIHRLYLTWDDLDKLRDRPGFNIPPRDQLLSYFFPPKEEPDSAVPESGIRNPLWDARAQARYEETTIDPFEQPLEVLERWDGKRYIAVLQKKLVICSDENPYGVIPFLSVGWWDVPEAFWSLGLAKTIGSEQRLQQGVTNAWLDGVSLNLNGVYVRVMGKSIPTQSIRVSPGKIVNVEKKDDFAPLDRLPAVPEAIEALQMSTARAEGISGANELITQGNLGGGGRSSITRTAGGANLLASGTGTRIQKFVDKIATQVIVPFLYAAHELNCSLMPMSTLREILDKELQHEFLQKKNGKKGGNLLEILNARLKFDITAAARLQARRNMAQALPIMIQFLMNQQTTQSLAIEGKKIDVKEVLRMLWTVSDWKNYNDIIVDMTPQDNERWQSMQPGAKAKVDAQNKMQMQQQQHDNKMELVDSENIARAGREVLRQALEQSAIPLTVQGEAGGKGFGSNVE